MRHLSVFVLLLLAAGIATAQSTPQKATATPWQWNKAGGPVDLTGTGVDLNSTHGNPVAYGLASMPSVDDAGWVNAPLNTAGNVEMKERSSIPCFKQVDFTFFRTWVNIPSGGAKKSLTVTVGQVDDGARMYLFNGTYPQTSQTGLLGGYYVPEKDGKLSGKAMTVDFTNKIVEGPNMVVLVQFDDCQIGNNLTGGIEVKYDDQVVVPAASCGDGVVSQTESCDLGTRNGVAGSGCTSACALEATVNLKATLKEHCLGDERFSTARTKDYTVSSGALGWDTTFDSPSFVSLAPHTGVQLFSLPNFLGQQLTLKYAPQPDLNFCDYHYPDGTDVNDRVGSLKLFYVE